MTLYYSSENTHKKLGEDVTWSLDRCSSVSLHEQRLAHQTLDRQCQESDAGSIGALASGLSRMCQNLPREAIYCLRGDIKNFSPSASAGSRMTTREIAIARRYSRVMSSHHSRGPIKVTYSCSHLRIDLQLPGILGTPIKLGEESRDLHVLVTVQATVAPHKDAVWSGIFLTLSEEIAFLGRATDLIIGRVCQATNFNSVKNCATILAEALLQFLKFRSTSLPLGKVKVVAFVGGVPIQHGRASSTAKLRTQQDVSTNESRDEHVESLAKAQWRHGVNSNLMDSGISWPRLESPIPG